MIGAVSTIEQRNVAPRLVLAEGQDGAAMAYAAQVLLQQAGFSTDVEVQRDMDVEPGLLLPGNARVSLADLGRVLAAVSLKRETEIARLDKHGRFPDSAVCWGYRDPWVSRLAISLRKRLEGVGVVPPGPLMPLRVVVTHDVDWVTPVAPVSILKSIAGRKIGGQAAWLRVRDALRPSLFLENLERLLELELRLGVHPWFFILGGRFGVRRYSNRYSTGSRHARRYIALIRGVGAEVGLHGSYYARDEDSYSAEAALLSGMVDRPVVAHRNHYLRFDSRRLWSQLERAGIRLDFSLCFNTRMGFRVPVMGPFHPFDWTSGEATSVWAIPTIAMDRVWWPDRRQEVLTELRRLLQAAGEVGGTVAILIHPEMLVLDTRWFALLEEVISVCLEVGASVGTTADDLLAARSTGGRD